MAESTEYRVLTAVGPDRAGLVRRISEHIHANSANIEDSRMAILGGEFAFILLFSGNPSAIAGVETGLEPIGTELGLTLTLRPTQPPSGARDYLLYRIKVGGLDQPGIVSKVTEVLAQRSVNVAALDTKVSFAPLSGTPMFHLTAELQIPSKTALSELRRAITLVCEEENLDYTLEGL